MADLVCNQRWTPGVWVYLATTKATGPTGQPTRLGGEPYRTEQLEDIRGSRGTNSSRTRHEKNDSTATMKEAHVVVVARAEGHGGATGMQTRQELGAAGTMDPGGDRGSGAPLQIEQRRRAAGGRREEVGDGDWA